MRATSARFAARLAGVNRWDTAVQWSNDGGREWQPATFVAGSVTHSQTDQVRWKTGLTLADVPIGRRGLNPFTTRLRVWHGMAGEPLLPMGVYKTRQPRRSTDDPDLVTVSGESAERWVMNARFPAARSFFRQQASVLVNTLLREVLGPQLQVVWLLDQDPFLPQLTEARDRWPLIDGRQDATSIARSLGGRIFAGPAGEFIAAPVPTLSDPVVWQARRGELLLSAAEELDDEQVYNEVIARGEDLTGDDGTVAALFRPASARDLDPDSLTFYDRPVWEGGYGPKPRFYTSQMITSYAQALAAAQGMLAPLLGARQQVSFQTVHDPRLEPGDVGIVDTADGPRRVLIDAVTHQLDGSPGSAETRTTQTRLDGRSVEAGDDQQGGVE